MEFVDMSTATAGTNEDLDDPISTALQRMGITPADITNVQDSDLAGVTNVLQLIELAELRLLENILGNVDAVDVKVGDRSESLSQLAKELRADIDAKTQRIEKEYGLGLAILGAGVINLDFQQHHDDVFIEE
jgi:hypothetical protein